MLCTWEDNYLWASLSFLNIISYIQMEHYNYSNQPQTSTGLIILTHTFLLANSVTLNQI